MPSMMNAQSSAVCSIEQMDGKYASKVPSKVRRAVKQRMIVEGIGFCEPAGVVVFSTFLLSSRGSSSILNNAAESVLLVSAESGDGIRLGETLSG